jgi:hypothetical protein
VFLDITQHTFHVPYPTALSGIEFNRKILFANFQNLEKKGGYFPEKRNFQKKFN